MAKAIGIRALIVLLGAVSYYVVMWALVYLLFEVLDLGGTETLLNLVALVAAKLVPLISALLLVAWLWSTIRTKGKPNESPT